MKTKFIFSPFILVIFSFITNNIYSQYPKWLVHTVSGQARLLDFTTATPTLSNLPPGIGLGAEEDINLMTDVNNNIIFSTATVTNNDIQVRDRNWNIMPNGTLRGNNSSFESAICKVPCSIDKYYFFHFKGFVFNDSLYYSIIDMSANGGLGDVIRKNIGLSNKTTEGLTISHQMRNGCRWLLTPAKDANNILQIMAFKISADQVSPGIVLASYQMHSAILAPRELELSSDNTKLAVTTFSNDTGTADILLWDFNLETGSLSNLQTFNVSNQSVLGLEFSPDASKIYYQTNTTSPPSTLGRIDLSIGGVNQVIDGNRGQYLSDIELAGNGRLYSGNNFGSSYMAEISNPNSSTIGGVGYNANALLINPSMTGCRPGLPNALDGELPGFSLVPSQIDFASIATQNCNEYMFMDSTCLADWWEWDFGDGQTSNIEFPTHTYQSAGSYTVSLRSKVCSDTLQEVKVNYITVISGEIDASPDQLICNGGSAQLTAIGGLYYTWSPAIGLDTTAGATVIASPTSTTVYTVTGSDGVNCTFTDMVTVDVVNPTATINANGPLNFCSGGSVTLTASPGVTYLWSTGDTTASILVDQTGSYSVDVFDGLCTANASVNVNVQSVSASIFANGPLTFCAGGSVTLTASAGDSYLWSTQDTTHSIIVNQAGTYTVTVTTGGCSATSSETISIQTASATITPGSSLTFCDGGSVILTANAGTSYLWSNSLTTQSITVTEGGVYLVTVTNGICSASSSVTVNVENAPDASTTPAGGVSICNGSTTLSANNTSAGTTYQWYRDGVIISGATQSSYNASGAGAYAVVVTSAAGCSSTSTPIDVTIGTGPSVSVSNSATVGCQANTIYLGYGPQSITLTAAGTGTAPLTYLWSNGQTTQSIQVTAAGTYSVIVTDANGCSSTPNANSEIEVRVVDIRCGNDLRKVIICHVPPGNPGNPQTLCIAPSAVPAHFSNHPGDCIGPCRSTARSEEISEAILNDEMEVIVSPNPSRDQFNIAVHSNNNDDILVRIVSVTGQVVFTNNMSSKRSFIIGQDIVPGVYWLEVIQETTSVKMLIVKQ